MANAPAPPCNPVTAAPSGPGGEVMGVGLCMDQGPEPRFIVPLDFTYEAQIERYSYQEFLLLFSYYYQSI